MTNIVPVIMCGGSGTRLWPLSRESLPKQFIPLFGERSTFQAIASLLSAKSGFGPLIVITNRDYRFLVAEQLEKEGITAQIVLEPVRRDSGPAVGVAAELALQRSADAIVAIMAADHAIANPDGFAEVIGRAAEAAKTGHIVTLGITPDHPATGYGYIRKAARVAGTDDVFQVEKFVEKPDAAHAAKYISEGQLWNSGNFIFPAALMRSEMQKFEPEMAKSVSAAVSGSQMDLEFLVLDETAFSSAPQKSIDFAVMERTQKAAVIPADIGWSDVGTWSSVRDLGNRDEAGNVTIGDGVSVDCQNVLVHSPDILTVALGLKDVVIVTTPDAVLAVDAAQAGKVKDLVSQLRRSNRREASEHRRMLRPWGYYQSVDEGARYQVKRIVVKPKGRLSLQKHHHRAEHWIVVKGTAEVTVGEKISLVHENESIFVPIGEVHRLANPGKIDLELIEVQTGSYLGEDDIVRVEDVYNRG